MKRIIENRGILSATVLVIVFILITLFAIPRIARVVHRKQVGGICSRYQAGQNATYEEIADLGLSKKTISLRIYNPHSAIEQEKRFEITPSNRDTQIAILQRLSQEKAGASLVFKASDQEFYCVVRLNDGKVAASLTLTALNEEYLLK